MSYNYYISIKPVNLVLAHHNYVFPAFIATFVCRLQRGGCLNL